MKRIKEPEIEKPEEGTINTQSTYCKEAWINGLSRVLRFENATLHETTKAKKTHPAFYDWIRKTKSGEKLPRGKYFRGYYKKFYAVMDDLPFI